MHLSTCKLHPNYIQNLTTYLLSEAATLITTDKMRSLTLLQLSTITLFLDYFFLASQAASQTTTRTPVAGVWTALPFCIPGSAMRLASAHGQQKVSAGSRLAECLPTVLLLCRIAVHHHPSIPATATGRNQCQTVLCHQATCYMNMRYRYRCNQLHCDSMDYYTDAN